MIVSLLLALAAVAQPPARADAPAACPKARTTPPALRAWPAARPLGPGLTVGRAVDLAPVPVANVRLAVQPSRPLSGTHLASASFAVKAAGRYRVAAGGVKAAIRPLWVDLAGADGQPLASVAHAHGPGCTGITKIVEFDLKPGRYTLLATGLTAAATVRVLVVRKP